MVCLLLISYSFLVLILVLYFDYLNSKSPVIISWGHYITLAFVLIIHVHQHMLKERNQGPFNAFITNSKTLHMWWQWASHNNAS